MAEFGTRKGGDTPSPPKKKKITQVIPSSDVAENGGAINVDETSPSKREVSVSERREHLRKETHVKRPEQETSSMLAVWHQRTPPVGMKRKSSSEGPKKSPRKSPRERKSGGTENRGEVSVSERRDHLGKETHTKRPEQETSAMLAVWHQRTPPVGMKRKSSSEDPGKSPKKSPRKSPRERKSGGTENRGRGQRACRKLDF